MNVELTPHEDQNSRKRVLAVILHGWGGNPKLMQGVADAAKEALEKSSCVRTLVPSLAYRNILSLARATSVVMDVLNAIDKEVEKGGEYDCIFIIGHSIGATIARRVFLVAAGCPPEFSPEQPLRVNARPWACKVERIILVGALNRGWEVSDRMSWIYSSLANVCGLLGHMSFVFGTEWAPTIFDFRLGAPFIAQTRLHWLAFCRWGKLGMDGENASVAGGPPCFDQISKPLLIHLIGTRDDLVPPQDQVDIAVDMENYVLIQIPQTGHIDAVDFSSSGKKQGSEAAEIRKNRFKRALTAKELPELDDIATHPEMLTDQVFRPELTVT